MGRRVILTGVTLFFIAVVVLYGYTSLKNRAQRIVEPTPVVTVVPSPVSTPTAVRVATLPTPIATATSQVVRFVTATPIPTFTASPTPDVYVARSLRNANKVCDVQWESETRCVLVSTRYENKPENLSITDVTTGRVYRPGDIAINDGYWFYNLNIPLHSTEDKVVLNVDGKDYPILLSQDTEQHADFIVLPLLLAGNHWGVKGQWFRELSVNKEPLKSKVEDLPYDCAAPTDYRCVIITVPASGARIPTVIDPAFGYTNRPARRGDVYDVFTVFRWRDGSIAYLSYDNRWYRVQLTAPKGKADRIDTELLK